MKLNRVKIARIPLIAALGLALLAGEAALAHPANVTGIWSVEANASFGSMRLTQHASNRRCKPITGNTLAPPLEGYYCPLNGRIVFARKITQTNRPFQFYEGYAGRNNQLIGGTFSIWNSSGGGLPQEGVDFNFRAKR